MRSRGLGVSMLLAGAAFVAPRPELQRKSLHSRESIAAHAADPERDQRDEAPSNIEQRVDSLFGAARDLLDSEAGRSVQNLVGEERLESLKAGVAATASGATAMVPISLIDPDRLTPRWEFQLDMLALDIFLFGVVYRYAIRAGDDNPMLKAGVAGAFALPRALFLVELPTNCQALPLNCGEPLGYFSWSMIFQALWQLFVGVTVLFFALYGLERAMGVKFVQRFSSQG
ncbi:unnamed protein product [Effrenium voratum]|uniref:Uncharacterized protein n=1 Tax=Effrenium voratum TaxID=2562239 RepID=A0AA36NKP5_9DINO|nr:unnamed protein product [Effrenium voratum]CAJ1415299.1 unnamed protein product [Effrenium voratum]